MHFASGNPDLHRAQQMQPNRFTHFAQRLQKMGILFLLLIGLPALAQPSTVYISADASGTVGSTNFTDADVIALNSADNSWSQVFDGSARFITGNINGFHNPDKGDTLLTFDKTTTIPGIGTVQPADIVKYYPSSGIFQLIFDGSDVGLSDKSEKIDAVHQLPNGNLLISTTGTVSATGINNGQGEDLLEFTGTLGNSTIGSFSMYFDGSDVGLSGGNVEGLWVDPLTSDIYLALGENFSVQGINGDASDILSFTGFTGPNTTGTFGLFWDGSAYGFTEDVNGLSLSGTDLGLPPGICLPPLFFADMEYDNIFDNGWGTYNGGDVGISAGSDGSEVPPLNGGSYALSFALTGYGNGGFGGFFRTFPLDLTGMTHFNFWMNPAAGQNYAFDVNLQEDDNADNLFDASQTQQEDDEFQYDLNVGPIGSGADIISGGGWQLVSIPLADFFDDNSIWQGNDVFDPFLSDNGQLINVVFAYVVSGGETVELQTDNWFFSCEDGFCASLKMASNLIDGKSYPAGAASDITAAISDLNAAIADCESNDVQEAYKDIEKAMNALMDAADAGADVSEEIAFLIALAQSDVNGEFAKASSYSGNPQVDNFISNANDYIADAAAETSEGNYNLAIRNLANARKELQHAIHIGSAIAQGMDAEADISAAISDIQDLIDNGGYSSNANADLQDAIDKLNNALADFNDGDIRDGFNDLSDAVEKLQDAADDGATTTDEINAIVDLARMLAEAKISEAQLYAGNPKTDTRLALAQKDMNDAADELSDGKPNRAIKEYRDAWEDARVALEHGLGLRKSTGDDAGLAPATFALDQNYPNPFNPATTIRYQLAETATVDLVIYNSLGQQVKRLASGTQSAGTHTLQWDGRSDNGQKVASGIYIYRITAGSFIETRKMLLMK